MTSKEEIRRFLLTFKQVVTSGSGVDLVPRRDTLRTLSFLGLTKKNLEEILLGLSVVDYCKGPIEDKDRGGELWEFGKNMDGYEVYIKLKVVDTASIKISRCISFHISKYPMKYPFKDDPQDDEERKP